MIMPRPVPALLLRLAVLVCLAVAAVGAQAAPANLLHNPGFEESLPDHPWMPAGWDTSRAGLSSVFFGRDTLLAHSGSYSVSVANASALYPLAHNWSQSLQVGPELWGKDLVFSVWTRTMGLEGRAYIKAEVYRDTIGKMAAIWNTDRASAGKRLMLPPIDDPILDLGWRRVFFSDPETEWVRREVRVHVAPSVNMAHVRLGLLGTGQLMVDDASLTVEPARPPAEAPVNTNLLADPGFEGDGNSWEYSLPPYADMRADRDTVVKRTGNVSLAMTSPPVAMVAGKAGVSQVLDARPLAGKRIRLTGYIKCDSLQNSAFLKLYSHGIGGIQENVSVWTCSGTQDWHEADVELDVPNDAYEVWAWFSYTAPTRGRVWFDDASLVVTGKATAVKP
jgi:hypothetical protein